MKPVNKVFFGERGLTSSSANHICNVCREPSNPCSEENAPDKPEAFTIEAIEVNEAKARFEQVKKDWDEFGEYLKNKIGNYDILEERDMRDLFEQWNSKRKRKYKPLTLSITQTKFDELAEVLKHKDVPVLNEDTINIYDGKEVKLILERK